MISRHKRVMTVKEFDKKYYSVIKAKTEQLIREWGDVSKDEEDAAWDSAWEIAADALEQELNIEIKR